MTRFASSALLLALALGCALPGLPREELGEGPIALHWFEPETLRRRAELIADANPATHRRQPAGVATRERVNAFMGRLLGASDTGAEEEALHEQLERRFPGRLALYYPRRDQVEPVESARPGAIPRAWSPDRGRLLFIQGRGRERQVYELELAGRVVRQLTRGPNVHIDGCYGPDGRYLFVSAEIREGVPNSRIVITDAGGVRAEPLSEGPADYNVACAPDGSAAAWVSVDETGKDWLVTRSPLPDGPVRRLGPGRQPAFSSDSEWLVYSAPRGDRWVLHRIRADGSGRRLVGLAGTGDEFDPSFSLDGRHVVYVSDDRYNQRIFVRRFDGSGDRVLLQSGGGNNPLW